MSKLLDIAKRPFIRVPAYPVTALSCLRESHCPASLNTHPSLLHLANSNSIFRTQFRCHFLQNASTDYPGLGEMLHPKYSPNNSRVFITALQTLCLNELFIGWWKQGIWVSFIAVSLTPNMIHCCLRNDQMYSIHNPCHYRTGPWYCPKLTVKSILFSCSSIIESKRYIYSQVNLKISCKAWHSSCFNKKVLNFYTVKLYDPRKMSAYIHQKTSMRMFLAALGIIVKKLQTT